MHQIFFCGGAGCDQGVVNRIYIHSKEVGGTDMDEGNQKGLSLRQRKSIAIRAALLFLCAFILYGEYTLQKAEKDRKNPQENAQGRQTAIEAHEKKKPVIRNTYQTKLQEGFNTYEIRDGKLYGSGENSSGQLGIADIHSQDFYEQPVLIAENVIHVDACGETLIYLNEKNELYGVGSNRSGQLGQPMEGEDGETDRKDCITEPVLIMDHVKYASAGGGYIMILQEDGILYTMGDNLNGQLGNGTARPVRDEWYAKKGTVYSSEPVHVLDDIAFIAADDYTAAAISKKGDLWVWGDNSFGEIGNRRRGNGMPGVSTDVVSEPYLVLKKVKEVRFEDYTVYAVTFQDQEYRWGKNATAFPKPIEET